MAPRQVPPLIVSEFEMARALKLLRRSQCGHVAWGAGIIEALTKATFPFAMEFWAATAPMNRRGDGTVGLTVPRDARCWPKGAEDSCSTAMKFRAAGPKGDTVIADVLTGNWQDANGRGRGFAYVGAVAGRVWRRPDDPCGPLEAAERVLALIGAGILLERMVERGYSVDADDNLPVVVDAPPLAPESEPGTPVAPPPAVALADHLALSLPVDVMQNFAAVARVLAWLASQPAAAEVIRAAGEDPAKLVASVDRTATLADEALAGRWAIPSGDEEDRADALCLAVALAVARARRGDLPLPPAGPAPSPADLRHLADNLHPAAPDQDLATALRARGLTPEVLVAAAAYAERIERNAALSAAAWALEVRRRRRNGGAKSPPANKTTPNA